MTLLKASSLQARPVLRASFGATGNNSCRFLVFECYHNRSCYSTNVPPHNEVQSVLRGYKSGKYDEDYDHTGSAKPNNSSKAKFGSKKSKKHFIEPSEPNGANPSRLSKIRQELRSKYKKNLNVLSSGVIPDSTTKDLKTTKTLKDSKETASRIKYKQIFVDTISNEKLYDYIPLKEYNSNESKIPRLRKGLDKVLFSPGAHFAQDPRTKRNNFKDVDLEVPDIDDFDHTKLSTFVSPEKDASLSDIASKRFDSKFGNNVYGTSTSSISSVLKDFHFLLSNSRSTNLLSFSNEIGTEFGDYSPGSKMPTSVVVKNKGDNVYSITADKLGSTSTSLSYMGFVFETLLTHETEDFQAYLKGSDKEVEKATNEYHYAQVGNFVLRSQLDTYHPELPGTGTFDLKSRGVCAVRHDLEHSNTTPIDYSVIKQNGAFESFEREMYDLTRTALIKYGFQARIGNMDGIFIAYHNLTKIFGYQYLPLSDIDDIIHGYDFNPIHRPTVKQRISSVDDLKSIAEGIQSHYSNDRELLSTYIADFEFKTSFEILTKLLDIVIARGNPNPFKMITSFGTFDSKPFLRVMILHLDEKAIEQSDKIQEDFENNEFLVLTEQQKQSKKPIEDMLISEKIRNGSLQMKEFTKSMRKLLYEIKDNCKDEDFYVFDITASHMFNGKHCEDKHPTPPIEAVHPDSKVKWTVKYRIKEIEDQEVKNATYSRYVKKTMEMVSSRSPRKSPNPDMVANSEIDEPYLDQNATQLQRMLRAYSARGARRDKIFENLPNNREIDN